MNSDGFVIWMCDNGAIQNGIQLRQTGECSEDRGLFATRSFRENEVILSVPNCLIITAGTVAEMPKQRLILEKHSLKPFEALVLFFLTEDVQTSPWAEYLRMLPERFHTPRMLYPNLNTECFPPDLKKLWQEQTIEIYSMYEKLVEVLPKLTWQRFLWAWHVVNTRCIYRKNKLHNLIDNSEGDMVTVVPLVDMLNHSNDSKCCAFSESNTKNYTVVALRSINEGDQIFICYGAHTNGNLWIDYGFRISNNICNKMELSIDEFLECAKSVGLRFPDNRRDAIVQAGFPWVIYANDHQPNFAMKVNLVFLHMDSEKVKRWSGLIYEEAEKIHPEDCRRILVKIREMLSQGKNSAPAVCHWLWDEEIALIDNVLTPQ